MLIDMISFTTICLIYLWFYYQHCMNEKYIGRELKIEKTEEDLKEVITIGYIVSIFMIFNIWKNRGNINESRYLLFTIFHYSVYRTVFLSETWNNRKFSVDGFGFIWNLWFFVCRYEWLWLKVLTDK